MGAKSNNLKQLKGAVPKWVQLPESGTIPFKMFEYTLRLFPETKEKIEGYVDQLTTVTKVRQMNRLLLKCKDLVFSLPFKEEDPHLAFIKKSLISFGISEAVRLLSVIVRISGKHGKGLRKYGPPNSMSGPSSRPRRSE